MQILSALEVVDIIEALDFKLKTLDQEIVVKGRERNRLDDLAKKYGKLISVTEGNKVQLIQGVKDVS